MTRTSHLSMLSELGSILLVSQSVSQIFFDTVTMMSFYFQCQKLCDTRNMDRKALSLKVLGLGRGNYNLLNDKALGLNVCALIY